MRCPKIFMFSSLIMSMSNSKRALRDEAQRILDTLAFTPFDQCQRLSRQFEHIPARPGLYAVRHRIHGLLYIGKSKSLRGRFGGGHKAFLWAWLDQYDDADVRIAIQTLSAWEDPALLLELEAIMLRATEPPYNVLIPMEK
jgi:excinuclease UvrABC nuclease subunit